MSILRSYLRHGRYAISIAALSAVVATAVWAPVSLTIPSPAAAAGTIAYPDLISVIPSGDFAISHPTAGTKEFDYEHIVFNAGQGPLDVLPSYDPATNTATGTQRLYSYDAGGNAVLESQAPVKDQFVYHALHGHFHFPLASFGLYGVNPDGSVGSPVALSPKNGFCIGDSVQLDPTIPHSPSSKIYVGYTCADPTAVRGIDPGWGDLYNRIDPGQAIDITGLPDGVYWFHSVVDPDNNFLESDKSNNVTDLKVQIQGDTVRTLPSMVSQGAFVIDKSMTDSGAGTASTPAFSTAAPNELLVALVAAQGGGNPQSVTVSGGGLTWTRSRQTNSQAGTAEVWTALAPAQLSNAVVTSTMAVGGFDQTLTVLAVQGAQGIGASAGASGASGAPSVGLTTTVPGSWVMAVGNDPDHDIPRTPLDGQTMVQQWVNESGLDTTWIQAPPGPTPAAGTPVTVADSYPVGDRWNLSAVELVPAVSNDHTAPAISGFSTTAVGPDRATVGWATDEPATTQINYGPTPALGQSTALAPALVTTHGQTITGLAPSTTYFCDLLSADSSGNQGVSTGHSFTTAAPRVTPPVFTNVRVTDLQPDQATFGWTTDEPADGQVEFGTTVAYGSASTRDPAPVTTHFLLVTGLVPSTTYHYRVNGTDPYGNAGASADATFTTPGVSPPIVVDKTVFKDGRGAQTTAPFSTAAPGELLVAFVASDGPRSGPQSAAVTGAGLSWTVMRRTNAQPGTAEVWQAVAPAVLTNVTVTASQVNGTYDQSLTVVAFQGAVGIGATASASAISGAPSATFTASRFGSLVYGVGNDWDRAVTRTPVSGQSLAHQWVDTGSGDTFWAQALNAPGGPVETLSTISDSAPINDRWNLTAVEITRPLSISAAPPSISAVAATNVGLSTATVSWTTDQPSSSQVEYGTTTAYGSTTTLDPATVLSHTQNLSGLALATTYHFRVLSTNSVGTTASPDATFNTLSGPTAQTITFAALPARTLAQSPLTVTATASSGLAVSFSSATPAVCTSGGLLGATITLVAAGTCTVQADQVGNATFNAAPSVPESFAVSTVPVGVAVDVSVFKDGRGAQTTAAFSTTVAGDLLLAFVASDGPKSGGQTAVVSGGGLTWTLVRRTNAQAGTSEIWQARAVGTLTGATVTSSPSIGGYDQSFTVVSFKGAAGIGATAGASALSGAPSASVTTTLASSAIYAVGNDWDRAVTRTVNSGQAMVHEWVDSALGDTFWTQSTASAVAASGTVVVMGDSAPTNDRWNLTAVEIRSS